MFDSNSLHCSNEKQESKMDSYYFKWWRLFQLLLSGNACPAFGATPHRRALRLVVASSVIRLIRFVAPPLPNTRGVSGTPNLIYALPQNSLRTVLTFEMRLRLSLGTVAFDSNTLHCSNEKRSPKWTPFISNGGDYWNRTNDPLHVKQVL